MTTLKTIQGGLYANLKHEKGVLMTDTKSSRRSQSAIESRAAKILKGDTAITENKPNRSKLSKPNHNLEAALIFMESHPGAALFPAKYISGNHVGQVKWGKESSPDPEQVKRWSRKWPNAYFCVNLKVSNLTVLDIDDKNGKQGSESLKTLESIYGDLPETRMIETPSGGRHYLFTGWCGKQTVEELGGGVDTPTMVPVPGSDVPGKGMYKIKKTGPIAPLPEWISTKVGEAKKRTKNHKKPAVTEDQKRNIDKAVKYANIAEPAVENAGGDNQTFKVACGIRDFGISRDICLMIMAEHYNHRCKPRWEQGDLKRIVFNAYEYALSRAGENLPEAKTMVGAELKEDGDEFIWFYEHIAGEGARGKGGDKAEGGTRGKRGDDDDEEDVIPFETYDVPEFSEKDVPPVLMNYAKAISEAKQSPVGLAIVGGLGALATASMGKYFVKARSDYTVPTNLYIFAVAAPSEKKSPVMAQFRQPLEQWEKEKNADPDGLIAKNKSERKTRLAAIAAIRRKAPSEKKPLMDLIDEVKKIEDDMPPEIIAPELFVCDVTMEGLGKFMSKHDSRASVMESEGGFFNTINGYYSSSKTPNIDLVLKAKYGENHKIDRSHSETIYIENALLTICSMIQPGVFNDLANNDQFRKTGFFDRFLVVLPKTMVGNRKDIFSTTKIPVEVQFAFESIITKILNDDSERVFNLSTKAQTIWSDFYKEIENAQKPGHKLHNHSQWAGKLPGDVLRIAGLFHHVVDRDGSSSDEISGGTMTVAINFAYVLVNHYIVAMEKESDSIDIKRAKRVLKWIRENENKPKPKQPIVREIYRSLLHGQDFKNTDTVKSALRILEDRSYVKPSEKKVGKKTVYEYVLTKSAREYLSQKDTV